MSDLTYAVRAVEGREIYNEEGMSDYALLLIFARPRQEYLKEKGKTG